MLLYSQITGGSVAKLSSNVIKQDIVDYLHNKVGLSKKELSGFVDDLFLLIGAGLINENKTVINNFGTVVVKAKPQRQMYNPKTGQVTNINSRKGVQFVPAKSFKLFLEKSINSRDNKKGYQLN